MFATANRSHVVRVPQKHSEACRRTGKSPPDGAGGTRKRHKSASVTLAAAALCHPAPYLLQAEQLRHEALLLGARQLQQLVLPALALACQQQRSAGWTLSDNLRFLTRLLEMTITDLLKTEATEQERSFILALYWPFSHFITLQLQTATCFLWSSCDCPTKSSAEFWNGREIIHGFQNVWKSSYMRKVIHTELHI